MTTASDIKSEKDLVKIAAKKDDQYAEVALTSLTAYSLFWLHQWQIPRTIEAIAIMNWRLFPGKFAMVGFQEYPDAFRTNRSLLQMQPKYRNLLTGAATKGFSLNERGMSIAKELSKNIGVPTTSVGALLGTIAKEPARGLSKSAARSIEPAREVSRIRESKLFEKWKSGLMSDRDLIHVHALLRIFDHTPPAMRKRAMKDLIDSANKQSDEEIGKFLQDVKRNFPTAVAG
jgi:hypothetical protein